MSKLTGKKILIISPRFPFPAKGAGEQDRLEGFRQLKRLGAEIKILSKIFSHQDKHQIEEFCKKEGLVVDLIYYEFDKKKSVKDYLARIIKPRLWDGSANEYASKDTKQAFEKNILDFRPNVVWFEFTYLWPLYRIARKYNKKIVVRSHNFEPNHFIQEDGYSILNIFKFAIKFINEFISTRSVDALFAISPKEREIYKRMGVKKVETLPLRSLSKLIGVWNQNGVLSKVPLKAFFSGSTYNVSHNKKTLEFLLKKVFPELNKREFTFYVIGSKFPSNLRKYLSENVIYTGYVNNMNNFISDMDIAITPSLMGAGMQQKIFEPIARGISTITSKRGLAGYDFVPGEDLLIADGATGFVEGLNKIKDVNLRVRLSENSLSKSKKIFNQDRLDSIVLDTLRQL